MRKLALLTALGLSACATLDPNVVTPNQALIAVNAYNTAVASGTAYLRLPLCVTNNAPCRTQALSQSVYTALRAGRSARLAILADLQTNTTAPITLVQTLQAAAATISSIPQN